MMLRNETALVTGASRGIGRAIALRLAQEGARVAGTATTPEGTGAISETLREWGGQGFQLDLRDPDAAAALVEDVARTLGAPSILVNNAGITRDTLLLRMKDQDWSEVLEVNLTAAFRLSRAVLRGMMKARHGRIINVGSVVGAMGNAGQANYCAAKAGLAGFSRSLAREIGSRGITVNMVAPGFIETDMTRELPDGTRQALLQQIPLERLGQVDDIAEAVVFLASPRAAYITGETLHVNGGLYMA
jgi:3-oxoacyl-[acyl-carrier protein] reductase